MSCILSVYSTKALKEYLLPAIDNADNSIVVSKSIFVLAQDVVILLEVVGGQWFIREMGLSIAYIPLQEKYSGQPLKNGDLLMLTLPEGQIINIIVKEVKASFVVYKKYDISEIGTIKIGRDKDCDIRYDFLNLVSGEHGMIRKEGNLYVVEDTGTNGIFINDMRMARMWKLSFGDRIDMQACIANCLIIGVNTDRGVEPIDLNIS